MDGTGWLGVASVALYLLLPIGLIFAFDLYKPAWLKFLVVVLPPFHILLAHGLENLARLLSHASRITLQVSRFTLHVSRITHHASRFTFHVSRFTFHASRITHHVSRATRGPSS
jgi:hypothetical protein